MLLIKKKRILWPRSKPNRLYPSYYPLTSFSHISFVRPYTMTLRIRFGLGKQTQTRWLRTARARNAKPRRRALKRAPSRAWPCCCEGRSNRGRARRKAADHQSCHVTDPQRQIKMLRWQAEGENGRSHSDIFPSLLHSLFYFISSHRQLHHHLRLWTLRSLWDSARCRPRRPQTKRIFRNHTRLFFGTRAGSSDPR